MDEIKTIYDTFSQGEHPDDYLELVNNFVNQTMNDKDASAEARAAAIAILAMNPNLGIPTPEPRKLATYLWGRKRDSRKKLRTFEDATINILAAFLRNDIDRDECLVQLLACGDSECMTDKTAQKFMRNKDHIELATKHNAKLEALKKLGH